MTSIKEQVWALQLLTGTLLKIECFKEEEHASLRSQCNLGTFFSDILKQDFTLDFFRRKTPKSLCLQSVSILLKIQKLIRLK